MLGFRRAWRKAADANCLFEISRSWRREIFVAAHPGRGRRSAEKNAGVIKSRERTNQIEPRTKVLVQRTAEASRNEYVFQLSRRRQIVQHDRHIDQRIIA